MTRYGGWGARVKPTLVTTVTPLDTKGPARLWNAPAGFVVRERGAIGAVSTNVYECPVHGQFEARCDGDSAACPTLETEWIAMEDIGVRPAEVRICGRTSPWVPSRFSVWASAGEVKS